MVSETAKKLFLSVLDAKKLSPSGGKHNFVHREMFKLSSLDATHAALVNKFWHFGGNERSQRFIERYIWTFPTSHLLGPKGTPVSWCLMDQTGELRMGGTVPEYREHGLTCQVAYAQTQTLDNLASPCSPMGIRPTTLPKE
ncbi:glycine-N-acyltransferase [Rhinolophus ferrumequinum]|uniref:Glycine N-acyltransferase-like protein n=1 Tax=Rhinolophus ferrumequinum TaxID=59479 RepID=A0A7J7W6V2_RHIFE|nr:glycine-N-acyltransferase [Rhinolophus ferrumequinum]